MSIKEAVWVDPERLSGAPAFRGTRVPLQNLFHYLRAGHTIEAFLEDFPGVEREQIAAVIDHAAEALILGLRSLQDHG